MIIGIDPGIRKLGFAIINYQNNIQDAGVMKLDDTKKIKKIDQYDRMIQIGDYFEEIFVSNKIDILSIEKYYITNINKSNAEFVYGVRAIIITQAIKNGIKIQEYTPIQLKKFITGNGKANKSNIQKTIMKLFNLEKMPEYHDASDALGLAYIASKIRNSITKKIN